MKTIHHLATVILLIFFTSSFIITNSNELKDQFIGTWASNQIAFKSITFMRNDMVKIITHANDKDVATHYHYKINKTDSENNLCQIHFFQKELFKDEYKLISSMNALYKKSNTIILISDNGSSIQFIKSK